MKSILFTLSFMGLSAVSVAQISVSELMKAVASDRQEADGFGWSVDIEGNYAAVGTWLEDHDESGANFMTSAGSVYFFERDEIGNWNQVQKLVPSDRAENDNFGFSVSISGDYLVVGAPSEDEDEEGGSTVSNAGSAYIFAKDEDGLWVETQKIVAGDRGVNDYFGRSLSLSGDYLILGAHLEDEDEGGGGFMTSAGSAYIFEKDGFGVWNQVEKIVSDDRASNDQFGIEVDISGNYAVVGAWYEDEDEAGGSSIVDAGSAYVFERDGGGAWSQVQKLVSSDRSAIDYFGRSVCISGSTVVVGAWFEDHDEMGENPMSDAGSVYVFVQDEDGIWNQTQKLVPSDRAAGDNFGRNISIADELLIVGAYREDHDEEGGDFMSNSGAAYLFERPFDGVWYEIKKLVASDRSANDNFGCDVAISSVGDIICGANNEDEDAEGGATILNAGSVYFFGEECFLPNITELNLSTTETICPGDEVSLFIIGFLNDAVEWVVYEGGCDVDPIASSTDWEFNFTPTASTTYFIRGEGGCADDLACEMISVNVHPAMSLSVETTDEFFGSDGSIDLTVSGGTPDFTFDWDNDGTGDFDDTEDLAEIPAGAYMVVVMDENNCTDTLETVVNSQLSIYENEETQLKLYPNPSKGDFVLELNEAHEGTISVYSVEGKLMHQRNIQQELLHHFSLDNLPSGLYWLKVQTSDFSTMMQLIIE
ncbi:MAG: T9SS type A sorting domain-containing protein [Flavobacteriales bacterium]|nr:T9SS type A sorting domain-containing protein [Flavobacteriales bacterium]